ALFLEGLGVAVRRRRDHDRAATAALVARILGAELLLAGPRVVQQAVAAVLLLHALLAEHGLVRLRAALVARLGEQAVVAVALAAALDRDRVVAVARDQLGLEVLDHLHRVLAVDRVFLHLGELLASAAE